MMKQYQNEEEINALVASFIAKTLPLPEWTHEAHLIVAIWFLSKYKIEEAICLLRSGIITYNQAVGTENSATKGYHETLTLFWAHIIAGFLERNKYKTLLETCNNFLLSEEATREYPLNFYSREVLFSTKARAFWVEIENS
jgi:hypothetical protein